MAISKVIAADGGGGKFPALCQGLVSHNRCPIIARLRRIADNMVLCSRGNTALITIRANLLLSDFIFWINTPKQ